MKTLEQLWNAHENTSFPEDAYGVEIEGEDLVSLDTYTVGCISSTLSKAGRLDAPNREALVSCQNGLLRVIPHLEGPTRDYYSRLGDMAALALSHVGGR